MSDITLFFRLAWENIWKQKKILFFSALSAVSVLYTTNPYQKNDILILLGCLAGILSLALAYFSIMGTYYIAYQTCMGESVSIGATFQMAIKLFWRYFFSNILVVITLLPFICTAIALLVLYYKGSMKITHLFNNIFIISVILMIYIALSSFVVLGFFEHDWGIRKSVLNAWMIFTNHFGVMALIVLVLIAMSLIMSMITIYVSVLVDSNLNFYALAEIDILMPYLSVRDNFFYTFLSSLIEIIWLPYTTLVFVMAYIKYREPKTSDLIIPGECNEVNHA